MRSIPAKTPTTMETYMNKSIPITAEAENPIEKNKEPEKKKKRRKTVGERLYPGSGKDLEENGGYEK